ARVSRGDRPGRGRRISGLETHSANRRKDRLLVGREQRLGDRSTPEQYLFDGMATRIGHDAELPGSRSSRGVQDRCGTTQNPEEPIGLAGATRTKTGLKKSPVYPASRLAMD